MRARVLPVAVVAVLALVGLTGCRSNLGAAAVVNGEKITDTQVSNAVTPSAKAVEVSQTASLAPRAFVVQILVRIKLFKAIVAKGPGGGPTQGELAADARKTLAGKSATAFAESQNVKGYSASFDRTLVDYIAYVDVLRSYSQNGVDIGKLAANVKMSVHLSPRYGAWDKSQLSLSSAASAGLPDFISLQPGAGAGAGTQSVPAPDDN